MAKMFMSLGFWMTIVLFLALGYTFKTAFGAECLNCGDRPAPAGSPVLSNENRHFENDLGASDVARRRQCAPSATVRGNDLEFQQMANLQQGGPSYAPGVSLTIARRPPQVRLCPGPIEIPRR
jgi:hypothetical protein